MLQLLTAEETRQELRIGREGFRALLKRRELEGFKVGNRWRFEKQKISNYINAQYAKQADSNHGV